MNTFVTPAAWPSASPEEARSSSAKSAQSANSAPVYRAGAPILKYRADDLTVEFAGPPKAESGTRYVFEVPTLWQDRHAGPQVIAQRILNAMGGDAQRTAERVRLVVGVNRRSSPLSDCPLNELAELSASLKGVELPMRTRVTFWLWRPTWSVDGQPQAAGGVREGEVRDAFVHNPNLRNHLENEDSRIATRDGIATMRTHIARQGRDWQNTCSNERVLTIVTDSDTEFPPNFFEVLESIPDDIRLATGGFRYNDGADAFSSLQNRLDMHIRSATGIDKRFVYLPEPSLVVDTSNLETSLDFGSAGLESRFLFNFLHNNVGRISPTQVYFDRRLEVITDASRFMTGRAATNSFATLLKSLCLHPQSHAGLFTWSKQVAAVANVRSDLVSVLGSLFSVPHILEDAVLRLEEIPAYLDATKAYFVNGQWTDASHPISSVFDRRAFPRSDESLELVVGQMHAWATATMSFINSHLTGVVAVSDDVPEAALCAQAKELYERDSALPSLEGAEQPLADRITVALGQRIAKMGRILIAEEVVGGELGLERKRSRTGVAVSHRSSHSTSHPIAAFGRYFDSPEPTFKPPALSDAEVAEAALLPSVRIMRVDRKLKPKPEMKRRTVSVSDVGLSRLTLEFAEELEAGSRANSRPNTPPPIPGPSGEALVAFELQGMVGGAFNDLSRDIPMPDYDPDDILADARQEADIASKTAEFQAMEPHQVVAAAREIAREVEASAITQIPTVLVQEPDGGKRRRLVRGSRSHQRVNRHDDGAYPESDTLLSELTDLIDTGGGILRTTSLRSDDGGSERSGGYERRRDALRELREAREASRASREAKRAARGLPNS